MKRNASLVLLALALCAGAASAKPPAPNLPAIKTAGKSGKFTIYDIQPKDDLDALKYFSGNVVYDPILMAPLVDIISPEDIKANNLTCDYLCADPKGNIVGRVRIAVDAKAKK